MKRTRDHRKATDASRTPRSRSRLHVVPGRAGAATVDSASAGTPPRVREIVVRRAQTRARAGYYERPAVQERLVDALWEELFTG